MDTGAALSSFLRTGRLASAPGQYGAMPLVVSGGTDTPGASQPLSSGTILRGGNVMTSSITDDCSQPEESSHQLRPCDPITLPSLFDATSHVLLYASGRTPQPEPQHHRQLVNALPLAIVALDSAGRVSLWNRAATQMLGWQEHEVLGQVPPIIAGNAAQTITALYDEVHRGVQIMGRELPGQTRRDGKIIDLKVWSSRQTQEGGAQTGATLVFADITEQRRLRAHLRGLAERDPLTDLPHRRHFRKSLQKALKAARANGQAPMVLILDMDRFRTINQAIGQTAGDFILKEVARRLAGHLYEKDLIARTGSDEFSILLTDSLMLKDSARIADRLTHLFDEPFEYLGENYYFTASIGIAVAPHDGDKCDTLLDAAYMALNRAKVEGGNRIEYFTHDLDQDARNQLALESKLRQAIENNELRLVYQPKFDIASGHIQGVEALLRWRHPVLGEISPGEFIPIAETSPIIHQIGAWVLQTACRQLEEWDSQGLHLAQMAVNISPRQFQSRNFLHEIKRIVSQSTIVPQRLELELTETVLMSNLEQAMQVLQHLRELGLSVAIDDFGTGYSSLAYLAQLPVSVLKIDQSFTRRITEKAKIGAIVHSIGELARGLDLRVVAEGVETEAQLAFLRDIHCHEAQGFLLSRPLPPKEIADLLRKQQVGN